VQCGGRQKRPSNTFALWLHAFAQAQVERGIGKVSLHSKTFNQVMHPVSYLERIPRQNSQTPPQMSHAASAPDLVLFEYDENLVFPHEALGLRARLVPILRRVGGAQWIVVLE
jgi:hypothetical protein